MPESNTNQQNQKMKNTLLAPILTAVVFLLLILATFLDKEILRYRDNIYLSVIILHLIIFILPSIFYGKLKGPGYVGKLNIKPFGLRKILFMTFILLAMLCAVIILKLTQFSIGIYGSQITHFDKYMPVGTGTDIGGILYAVLAYAILPAVSEEFLFRGIMMTEYKSGGVGGANAIILTALLSSMIYFNFANFPIFFITGIVFGIIAFVTQSLVAATFAHLIYNLFGLFVEDYIIRLASQTGNLTFFIFILLTGILIFLIFTFTNAERIFYNYSIDEYEIPDITPTEGGGLRRFSEAFISPSYLVCLILFLVAALGV